MTLQDLANLGEFLAAIGVLVSLVYVAVQVRQNTRSIRAQTYQAMTDSSLTMLQQGWGGDDVREFWLKLQRNEPLDEADQARLHFMSMSVWRLFDNFLYQREAGTLEEDVFQGYEHVYLGYLRVPAIMTWLAKNEGYFSKSLRSWLELQEPLLELKPRSTSS